MGFEGLVTSCEFGRSLIESILWKSTLIGGMGVNGCMRRKNKGSEVGRSFRERT